METKSEKNIFNNSTKKFTVSIGWLQIVASPLIVCVILCFILYLAIPGIIGIIACIAIVLTGLFIGINWANKTNKQIGAIEFLARNISTPELDKETEL